MRWSILLQDYKFVILHRAGNKHGNADGLSRLICSILFCDDQDDGEKEDQVVHSVLNTVVMSSKKKGEQSSSRSSKKSREEAPNKKEGSFPTPFKINKYQHQDLSQDEFEVVYQRLHKKIWEEQNRDKGLLKILKQFSFGKDTEEIGGVTYVIEDSLLKRVNSVDEDGKRKEKKLLLVPQSLQREMICVHHDHHLAGHFGAAKTLKRLQQYYFWNTMSTDVVEYVRSCKPCQRNNAKEMKHALPKPVIPRGPFDIVAWDCLQLPESKNGNNWILVAIDYFTKYANTYVLQGSPTAEGVLRCVLKYICQHSLVREFRLDAGVEFTNHALRNACAKFGIKMTFVPTGHHRAHGLVERFNRTFQNSLCKVLDETVHYRFWEEYVDGITYAYNTSFHEGIQDTPFFMVYGRHAILPADSWIFEKGTPELSYSDDDAREEISVDLDQYKKDMMLRFQDTYKRARICLQKQYDALLVKASDWKQPSFDVGEDVWAYLPELQKDKDKKSIAKLTYQWFGPLKIIERHPESDVLYLVLTDRKIKFEQYLHVNRLRKYVSRESKPTDQVLPVPTYEFGDDFDFNRVPLPDSLSTQVNQDLSHADEDIEFELIEHARREPTIAEESLVGKIFIDEGDRFIVRFVKYHPEQKIMLCWYEKLEKRGDKWVGTGHTERSSIPEVQHWIERSAAKLYPSNRIRRSARNRG